MTIPLPVRSCIVTYLGEGRGLHYSLGVSAGERLIAQPIGTSLDLFTADQLRAYGEAVRAEERECLRVMIAALHREAKGQHNLYHCLSVELFGDEAIRSASPPQCTAPPSEPR